MTTPKQSRARAGTEAPSLQDLAGQVARLAAEVQAVRSEQARLAQADKAIANLVEEALALGCRGAPPSSPLRKIGAEIDAKRARRVPRSDTIGA